MYNRKNFAPLLPLLAALFCLFATANAHAADDVADTISNNPDLSSLATALKSTDLLKTLHGKGPFTVFAPNNAAFEKVGPTALAEMMKPENRSKRVLLIKYHIVKSNLGAFYTADVTADAVGKPSPATLSGETITLTAINPITLNNNAKVVTADIKASNGVIHIIDNVLLPPGMQMPATTAATQPSTAIPPVAVPATAVPATVAPAAKNDLVAVINGNPSLSTLATAIKAAGLTARFQEAGPFTLLAPTNDAFAKLPAGTLDDLLKPENKEKLRKIILNHVGPGKYVAADLQGLPVGGETQAMSGETLRLTGLSPISINNIKVTATDIMADNGVIHTIDGVILPGSANAPAPADTTKPDDTTKPANTAPADAPTQTVLEVLKADADYSTFVSALEAAGLDESLSKRMGPFTVFAPTNAAFAKIPKATLEDLLKPENRAKLQDVLTYHMAVGRLTSDTLSGMANTGVKTLNRAAQLSVSPGAGIKVGEATVVKANIAAKNGIIHAIDTVLMPPAPAK